MNAIPKENEKPRRELVSSIQQELVVLDEYEQHLVTLWREVGSVSQGGMGVAPLVWTEIIAWANQFYSKSIVQIINGLPIVQKVCTLEDYELEIIMQLSREYCNEYAEASDPNRECPKEIFLDEIATEDAIENANAIEDMFMSFWGKPVDTTPEIVRNT